MRRIAVLVVSAVVVLVAGCGAADSVGEEAATGARLLDDVRSPGASADPVDDGASGSEAEAATKSAEATPLRTVTSDRLEPGTYATSIFTPGLRFTVGDGWRGGWPGIEAPVLMVLHRGRQSEESIMFLHTTDMDVFDPQFVTDAELFDKERRLQIVDKTDDLVRYLQGVKHLDVSEPVPVTVGGRSGSMLEYRVRDLPDEPETCPEIPTKQCIVLFARGVPPEGVEILYAEGDEGRWYVLDDIEPAVLVDVVANKGDDSAFMRYAEVVVDSIVFTKPEP